MTLSNNESRKEIIELLKAGVIINKEAFMLFYGITEDELLVIDVAKGKDETFVDSEKVSR